MSTIAFAATINIESGSTETSPATETTQYTYYQIFDASIKTSGTVTKNTGELETAGVVAYTIPAVGADDTATAKLTALSSAIDGLTVDGKDLFTVTKSADGTVYTVVLNKKSDTTDFSGAEIAAALNVDAIKNNALSTGTFAQTAPGATATKDGLDAGYYLITSSLGTTLAVQTLDTVTIKEKNDYPSNTKEEDKTTAAYGEDVTYTVEVVIPASVAEKDIVVVDTITKGLTMDTSTGAIAVTIETPADPETETEASSTPVTTLTWGTPTTNPETVDAEHPLVSATYKATIPAATVKANAGKTLTLTYKATVNEKAVVNVAEKNDAHIEYDHYVTKDVEVEVKTHGFTLKKIDGANVTEGMTDEQKFALTALNGAEFTLWTKSASTETGDAQIKVVALDADGAIIEPSDTTTAVAKYRVAQNATEEGKAVNIKVGEATIDGLAEGTYYLQEDVAPTGYNPLTTRQPIAVSASTSPVGVDIAVENNAGSTLPSTGGIGTTIFYIVGAILVIGAGVLLVTRRRMRAE